MTGTIRVVDLNTLAQRWEKKGDLPYSRRVGRIAKIVDGHDLAILQESFLREASILRDNLSGWAFFNAGPNTIMWRRSKLTWDATSGSSRQLVGSDDRRLVGMAFLEGFTAYSIHLTVGRVAQRLRAQQTAQALGYTRATRPAVLGGDLNSSTGRTVPGFPRYLLDRAGFKTAPIKGKGLDELAVRRLPVTAYRLIDPGVGSDHPALSCVVTLPSTPDLIAAGANGAMVVRIQTALNRAGAKLDVDGDFGGKTTEAVRAFQKARKLDADGIVGKDTRGALWAAPTT